MLTSKSYNKKDSRLLMALLLGLLLALSGCGGSSSSDIGGGDNGGAGSAGDQSLVGVAQKGSFQIGSEARIWPLMNGEKQGAPIKVTLGERGGGAAAALVGQLPHAQRPAKLRHRRDPGQGSQPGGITQAAQRLHPWPHVWRDERLPALLRSGA